MIQLWEELDFHSVTYADGPDGTCRHAWYATCMHTWLRLSDSRDSGEDMKECGRGQSERHAESWRGRKKDKGRALPLPSFLPIFFVFFFFMYALSRFSGRDYLGAWNIRKPRRVFDSDFWLPTFEVMGVASCTHGTHVRTWKSRVQKRHKMYN